MKVVYSAAWMAASEHIAAARHFQEVGPINWTLAHGASVLKARAPGGTS